MYTITITYLDNKTERIDATEYRTTESGLLLIANKTKQEDTVVVLRHVKKFVVRIGAQR